MNIKLSKYFVLIFVLVGLTHINVALAERILAVIVPSFLFGYETVYVANTLISLANTNFYATSYSWNISCLNMTGNEIFRNSSTESIFEIPPENTTAETTCTFTASAFDASSTVLS